MLEFAKSKITQETSKLEAKKKMKKNEKKLSKFDAF
jgi:hypothetical protein